jgi:hypothetical protein
MWGRAFALTLAVELIVAVPLLRWLLRRDAGGRLRTEAGSPGSWARIGGTVVLASVISHPILWFGLSWLLLFRLGLTYPVFVIVGEAWVVTVEALVYWRGFCRVPGRWAVATSLLANGLSYGVGESLRHCTDWMSVLR